MNDKPEAPQTNAKKFYSVELVDCDNPNGNRVEIMCDNPDGKPEVHEYIRDRVRNFVAQLQSPLNVELVVNEFEYEEAGQG